MTNSDAITPIPTRWVVLTGPPASGKTVLQGLLADAGETISADSTRKLIIAEAESGRSPDAFRFAEDFQPRVLDAMLAAERSLDPEQRTYLEYALPCNIAFHRTEALPVPDTLIHAAQEFRYEHIMILDPLPWQSDDERIEGAEYQSAVHAHLWSVYLGLGYDPVQVPPLSPEERLAFVQTVVGD